MSESLSGWALLLAAIWLLPRNSAGPNFRLKLWAWWVVLAGVLLVFRWPLVSLRHELYPDETQMLAGALTLRHDPVFWRSVDGGTAGPLDYYALLPAAFWHGSNCYVAGRVIACLLIWGTLVAAGEAIALVTDRAGARIVVMPALMFEAFTTSPEFVHYASELMPDFLLAVAVLVMARQSRHPKWWHPWVAALLLGATPFAKLQAGPMAAYVGLMMMAMEVVSGRLRNLGPVIIGACFPSLLAGVLVTATGQAENLVIPYFLQTSFYAHSGRLPFGQLVHQLAAQSVTNGYSVLWYLGSAVYCTLIVVRFRPMSGRTLRLGLAAIGFWIVAAFCILCPGRPYQHYFNLLTLPIMLLTGIALSAALEGRGNGRLSRRLALPTSLFVIGVLLPQASWRVCCGADPFAYYNLVASSPSEAHRQLVEKISVLSAPGQSLGIWGWSSSLYVETGLYQATRQAHTESQLVFGPWQKYYLRRYYEDIVAAAPQVFVDATGPGNYHYSSESMRHEMFPPLREWVRANYHYLGKLDGVRLFVRAKQGPTHPPE